MNRTLSPLCLLLFLVLPALPQAPYGLSERVSNTSFLPSSSGYALGEMQLRRIFSNISLAQPVFLTHAGDGSDRIFVVERAGRILVFPNRDDVDTAALFLDLRDAINSGPGEAGLLSIAFHPRYVANGLFYVYYTYGGLISRISEFHVSTGDPDRADISGERILLEIRQPAGNHNGGQLAFDPDGYLYIGLGDGGAADDRYKNGQNPTTLLGSILRIDVDRTDDGLEYAIPPENPFIDHPEGRREEIWAWGLRNPWRFSFDLLTGDLWVGDVGQNRWEEIDLIERGGNYGWNAMEGSHCFNPPTDCRTDGLILPIAEYDHGAGRSVTGGYVSRGSRLVRLQGTYLYGDFVTRTIWGLRYADGRVTESQVVARSPSPVASFGEDESGEVYVVGYDGKI
ncbi:MAG: glucose sorbosone dehydrogenase, partial [Gemmatimonadetes bacterium]|nr:glucose sorbosone dehydrogenase [Gemmatimonadota bacterium]